MPGAQACPRRTAPLMDWPASMGTTLYTRSVCNSVPRSPPTIALTMSCWRICFLSLRNIPSAPYRVRCSRSAPRRGTVRPAPRGACSTCARSSASRMPARAEPARAGGALGRPHDTRGTGPPGHGPAAHRWAACPAMGRVPTAGQGHVGRERLPTGPRSAEDLLLQQVARPSVRRHKSARGVHCLGVDREPRPCCSAPSPPSYQGAVGARRPMHLPADVDGPAAQSRMCRRCAGPRGGRKHPRALWSEQARRARLAHATAWR